MLDRLFIFNQHGNYFPGHFRRDFVENLHRLDDAHRSVGRNVLPEVRETRTRMAAFAEAVRSGAFQGQGGAITDVVNIGIGGSDLGPAMGVLALAPYHDGPRCHFVSNVDGALVGGASWLLWQNRDRPIEWVVGDARANILDVPMPDELTFADP